MITAVIMSVDIWYDHDSKEVLEWLSEHVGHFIGGGLVTSPTRRCWSVVTSTENRILFQFSDAQDAILFKLTWGGR